ncbi:MAG TPA: NAD-dependent epimerase/dehydratase family protein [Caldimonas sp.]|jgi:nucleoside-diphosphate-sugar epimerase|nr:NAD-dependent epimerase/dehydratase family protein [Caldimonas sp.]HEX2543025.1 NAD-dependent epimerase/dehydratase family protein [Caldimonas sp.]
MRVLVTGADGFIGRALVAALGTADEIRATDRGDGDIADPDHVARLFADQIDRVFHLAGIPSGATEADYAAGRRVNVDATTLLLRQCRHQVERGGPVPRFVYASSIAVFGVPLPARIDDATVPAPSLAYGTQKRTSELLVDEATRRGDVDGRSLRLSGVVVRRAPPNGALSAFNSDLIREPLAGRDYTCPVGPQATIWITSLGTAVDNLIRLADVDGASLGTERALTAPALAVLVADIVAALGRVDAAAAARVRFQPQAKVEAQFARWPLDCAFERAAALGLRSDPSIDALVRSCQEPSNA